MTDPGTPLTPLEVLQRARSLIDVCVDFDHWKDDREYLLVMFDKAIHRLLTVAGSDPAPLTAEWLAFAQTVEQMPRDEAWAEIPTLVEYIRLLVIAAEEERAHVKRLLAALDAAEARAKRAEAALCEAAEEINCAGPVAHRIRVMRQEYSDALRAADSRLADARREALEEAATGLNLWGYHYASQLVRDYIIAPRPTEPPPQGEFSHVTHCGCPECRPTEETTT